LVSLIFFSFTFSLSFLVFPEKYSKKGFASALEEFEEELEEVVGGMFASLFLSQ